MDAAPSPDAALLGAIPLDAREVCACGLGDLSLAGAYLGRNPRAVWRDSLAGAPPLDAAVFTDWVTLQAALRQPHWSLATRGVLAARLAEAELPIAQAALRGSGFEPLKAVRAGGSCVLVAGRRDAGFPPSLHLEVWAFAPDLMDVRARLPAERLSSDPRLSVSVRTRPFRLPALAADAPKVLVLQRPSSQTQEAWVRMLAPMIAGGWAPVLEYDDHPALVAQAQGRAVRGIDWLKASVMFGVQTSTPLLAEAFGAHNPEVKVFRNAVFDLPPPPAPGRPPRIFYGAVARGPLAVEMARALAPALARRPETEVVVVGDPDVFEALPTPRKRYFDYLPYAGYLAVMRSCTVALSPLEEGPQTAAKSDAKYLDAAASGALMIASPTVYRETIVHGVNGLIAERLEDWPDLVAAALTDEAATQAMALRAWAQVRHERMFADQFAERTAWYRSLWARRAELAAALCERLPAFGPAIARAREALARP